MATDKFPAFAKAIEANHSVMSAGELYVVESPDIFDVYLAAFPDGTNPIFRVRTEHDCSLDKQFVRNLGCVVAIKHGVVQTVWDVPGLPYPYDVVAATLADHVRSLPIVSVYRSKERQYGAEKSVGLLDGAPHTFWHFWGRVGAKHFSTTPDKARGDINTTVQVFQRGLDTLSMSAINTVLDLINANSLYRGAEFRNAVVEFAALLNAYQVLNSDAARALFAWSNFDSPAARFRNTAMGTLSVDLSSGVALDDAVRMFESKVAPQNYKRTTALITPKMIENAVAELAGLGLEDAIERRHARLPDISVSNVLFVDNSVRGAMKDGLVGLLSTAVKPVAVDVKNAEPITIDRFLSDIVPKAASIDLMLDNRHLSNFVSLTAPVHADTGRLFKWNNGFAWSYDGDVADSIKEKVKRAGGKIDADLRVSLAWSNHDDLDLHAEEPFGRHVYWRERGVPNNNGRGTLDVDMNNGFGNMSREPVENIVWNGRMRDGLYFVKVHQFRKRENDNVGFTLETEYNGVVTQYRYNQAVNGFVPSLVITVTGGAVEKIEHTKQLTSTVAPVDKWGVRTQTLVPVNTLLASPNHWDDQTIGNKHWFFVLKGCVNPEPVRGIYNEFLRGDLEQHRKVFEVLGAKTKAPFSPDQLSGVGFSSTQDNKAVVVVKGERLNKAYAISF